MRTKRTGRTRVPPALRHVIRLLAFYLVLHYLLFPQLAGFRSSTSVLADLHPLLIVLAVAAQAMSIASYSQATRALLPAAERPSLLTVMRVQLATLAANHVLPGGSVASVPIGFRMLQRTGVSASSASFVLTVQTIGSAVVLNLILWLALFVSIPIRGANKAYAVAAFAGVILFVGFAGVLSGLSHGSKAIERMVRTVGRLPFVNEERVSRFLHGVVERARQLTSDPKRMRVAAGWAAAQWLSDAASLWLFLAAVGRFVTPDALLVAFGMANVVAVLPITPGGVGLYEAVLTSSLVGFGVPRAPAIIAVLGYRLIAFWIPIPIGAVAFLTAVSGATTRRAEVLEEVLTEAKAQRRH
jgi:putative heme transporter